MSGHNAGFVHLGIGGGAHDPTHRGGLADIVDLADERQDRSLDLRQRDELVADDEATQHHSIVHDELLQQVGERGARVAEPAVGLEEAPLAFLGQQRLAIVQLAQEVQARADGLDRVQGLEAQAHHGIGDGQPVEHVVGEEVGGVGDQSVRQPEGHARHRIHRATEGDDGLDALAEAVGRGLVCEHAALRITHQVHGIAGDLVDRVDGTADREHMVGEVTVHAALFGRGRAEIDYPAIDSALVKNADRAVRRVDVPDLGGDHDRRHQDNDRSVWCGVIRKVVPQAVHPLSLDHLVRRRFDLVNQSPEPDHLESVLCGRDQTLDRTDDGPRIEFHGFTPGHFMLLTSAIRPDASR